MLSRLFMMFLLVLIVATLIALNYHAPPRLRAQGGGLAHLVRDNWTENYNHPLPRDKTNDYISYNGLAVVGASSGP
jgi:hypothetical protein